MYLNNLDSHIISLKGQDGLSALSSRIEKQHQTLNSAWIDLLSEKPPHNILEILGGAITEIDSDDIRPKLIPLRIHGPSTGIFCKLLRVIFEQYSNNNIEQQIDVLKKLASIKIIDPSDSNNISCLVVAGAAAALAEIYLEKGLLEFDLVEGFLNHTFTWGKCPYSEFLLRKVIEKRQSVDKNYKHAAIPHHDFSNRFCSQPFSRLATLPPAQKDLALAVFACSCPGMLPYPLNTGTQQRNSEEIWNGPEAQEIRRSILDGDYTYCSPMLCPYLIKNNLPLKNEVEDPIFRDIIDNHKLVIDNTPADIMLAHDVSCNIACPSCRNELLTEKREVQEKYDRFVNDTLFPLLGSTDVYLHISGDGDPIGSRHYRKLLHSLDPVAHSKVNVALHSNGLLITEQEWNNLSHIHALIKNISISIDAACKETYEDLRRPGKWDVINRNMEFLAGLRIAGKLNYLTIQFVVQQKNFREIPAFIELGKRWSVDKIYFSRLFPTIHQDSVIKGKEDYRKNSICETSHPQHAELLEVLQNPLLRCEIVDMFNISQLIENQETISA